MSTGPSISFVLPCFNEGFRIASSLATLESWFGAPGPRLRVLGSDAAYTVAGLDGQEEALAAGARPGGAEPWGVEPPPRWGRLSRGEDDGEKVKPEPGDWPRFYSQLAAALTEGAPLPVDA